jgi:hypothetical protein
MCRRKEQRPLVEEGRLPKKEQQPLERGERGGAEGKSSGRRGGARMGRRRRTKQRSLVEEGRLPKKEQQPLDGARGTALS